MKNTWYQLPEDQCERVNRTEMQALRWSLTAVNSVAYAERDLEKRLECVPNGKARWRLMLGQLRALCNDLVGTIPEKQKNAVRNVMSDMEVRLVPKMTPYDKRIVMGVDDLSYIVAHAKKDICLGCTYSGDECRQCELCRILEGIAPLQDWGSDALCPYSREDWWDR